MRFSHLIPILIGVAILLFGIYLVSTNGYLDGKYLPSFIGIQPCSTGSPSSPLNGSGCTGFGAFEGFGVGTIVCISGLGIIGGSLRRGFSSPAAGSTALTPEALSALVQGQSRSQAAPMAIAPGPRLGTVYCSTCGAANPSEAKFCHQCATAMPGAAPPAQSAAPPSVPPGAGG